MSGKDIFEGGFKLSASEKRDNLECTDPTDREEIGRRLGGNWGVIRERLIKQSLSIYEK